MSNRRPRRWIVAAIIVTAVVYVLACLALMWVISRVAEVLLD